ncbi:MULTISPECIES: hypothetical protein [Cyanophyceae]|nr:hypothetical protein [Trichocoleus sp. FACHB-69]
MRVVDAIALYFFIDRRSCSRPIFVECDHLHQETYQKRDRADL